MALMTRHTLLEIVKAYANSDVLLSLAQLHYFYRLTQILQLYQGVFLFLF